MKKNFITFTYGEYKDTVAFVAHAKCYEIIVVQHNFSKAPDFQSCYEVTKKVKTSLSDFTGNTGTIGNSTRMKDLCRFEFVFDCPDHPDGNHFCVVDEEINTSIMQCETTNKPVKMTKQQQMWFCQVRILLIKLLKAWITTSTESYMISCHFVTSCFS